jgi:hypothetical protein
MDGLCGNVRCEVKDLITKRPKKNSKGISKTLLDALEDLNAYLDIEKKTLLTMGVTPVTQRFGFQSQGSLGGPGSIPIPGDNEGEALPSQYQGSSVSPSFRDGLIKQNAICKTLDVTPYLIFFPALQAAFKRRNEESGLYRYADGSWYKGEWFNGKRHGKGDISRN